MNKLAIRKAFHQVLNALPLVRRQEASQSALIKLREIIAETKGPVMSFMSMPHEIDLRIINRELAEQNRLVLPRVPKPKTSYPKLECYLIQSSLDGLEKSKYGIWEPSPKIHTEIDLKNIEIILVPAMAFDKTNMRLGHGGGYYDWLLSRVGEKTRKIGIGFKEQMSVFDLPREVHDQDLDQILLF